jgi:drug/metabolite transporter (DMT)-like permease
MPKRPLLLLHFLVLIWGFTAVLGLKIEASTVVMLVYRTLFTVFGIAVVMVIKQKNIQTLKRIFNYPVIPALGVGIVLGIHWMLFFGSARVSNASVSLAGLATMSLWTAFLEPLAFKRRIRGVEILLGLAVMLGLYIIFRFQFNHALGLLLAVGGGLLGAVMNIANAKISARYDVLVLTFWEMTGAFLTTLCFLPFFAANQPYLPSWTDIGWIVVLAWGCTVYPFTTANNLLRHLSPFTVSLALNLEPVYGIALAFLFLGKQEQMNVGFYLGATVILGSVLAYSLWQRRVGKRES